MNLIRASGSSGNFQYYLASLIHWRLSSDLVFAPSTEVNDVEAAHAAAAAAGRKQLQCGGRVCTTAMAVYTFRL